ncbi:MAG: hypothetical protein PVJ52_03795 [Candidatus Woesebacteria bacterium]|jgi:hypothetical protein
MAEKLRTINLGLSKLPKKNKYLECNQIISDGPNVGKCKPFVERPKGSHPCHICPEAISDHERVAEGFGGSTVYRRGFYSIETTAPNFRFEHIRGEVDIDVT